MTGRRVVIETPLTGRADGNRCTEAEVSRNLRYLERCTADSLARGESPFTPTAFYKARNVSHDTVMALILRVAQVAVVYADHGVDEEMSARLDGYDESLDVEYRWIGLEPD